MPDTTTPVLGLVKQTIGGNRNTWGAILNSDMDLIEGAFYGVTSKTVTGGSYTLTDSERRKRVLVFSGTLTSNQTIVVANLVGKWRVQNLTDGAFTLSIKTASGTAVIVPAGHCDVWCNGADGVFAGLSSSLRDTQLTAPDGTLVAPGIAFGQEVNSGWYRAAAGDWRLSILGVQAVQVTAAGIAITGNLTFSGNFAFAGTFGAGDGTANAPGISFSSEMSSGFYRSVQGDVGFSVLQSKRIEITSTGFTWLGNTLAGSDLSPTAISSNQNNYSPPGLGLILTLGAITGGSSYSNGTYADVPLTGGAGSGGKATIVVSSGAVSSVTLTCRGLGFVAGDTLSAAAASIGGTGSGFSVPVATVDAGTGSCWRLNITAACVITGMAGGVAGLERELINVGTATGQFPANSSSSSPANRFANTFNLAPGQSITCRYDATSNLWRPKNIATAFSSCAIAAVSPDLLIVNHPGVEDTRVDITASEATLVDGSGNAIKFENISVSPNSATTGPNGCDTGTRGPNADYHHWLVSDGMTLAGVHSRSSSLTTVIVNLAASGFGNYIYGKRVGGRATNGSSNFYRIRQSGQDASVVVTTGSNTPALIQLSSGTTGDVSTPTWTGVSLAPYVPSTAALIRAVACALNNPTILMVAPNPSYGNYNSATNPPPVVVIIGSLGQNVSFGFVRESSNIYWANNNGAILMLSGWKDQV